MADKKTKVKLPVIQDDDAHLDPDNGEERKYGLVCGGCDLEHKPRVLGTGASGSVDIMFVSESPSSWSASNKEVFYGRGGRVIRDTWKKIMQLDDASGRKMNVRKLRKFDTYAVQCQVEEGREAVSASASTINRCSNYLQRAIKEKKPRVVVVFGSTALKATGYKTEKFTEARGRVLDVDVKGHKCKIVPTFSTKHLMAKTGLYNLFYNDFMHAVRLATGVDEAMKQITVEEITARYAIPKTVEEVRRVCDEAINHQVHGAKTVNECALALDTETNTLHPHRADAKVLCVSVSWGEGLATAIPLYHKESPWNEEEQKEVLFHIRRVLECPKPKVFHNAKFDLKFLELRHGLRVENLAWDTLLGEHLLREDQSGAYSLKILGRSYFPQFANYADQVHELAESLTAEEAEVREAIEGVRKQKVKKGTLGFDDDMVIEITKNQMQAYLFGSKKDRKKRITDSGYENVPLDTLLTYAAIDTDLTRRLLRHQFMRMKAEGFMAAKTLMNTHALPATRSLGRMEFKGMRVDRPYLMHLEEKLTEAVDIKHEEMRRHWDGMGKGEIFNPNSTSHIGWLLYQKGTLDPEGNRKLRYGPWVERNVKSQQLKTDKKTLKSIVEKTQCPFTASLLAYRAAHKATSGFLHDLKLLTEYDGFLHTSFHLHGTSTGRLSSSNLNMQNIPKFIAGFNFKKIFIPDESDEVIVNLDYKGAEIRVFTAYANDPALVQALNDGLDVHSFFAQEIYGVPYEEIQNRDSLKSTNKERYLFLDQMRTNCKRVVFGILYGAMAKKIAETAGISEEAAQEVIDKLFLRFPSLKDYMDETTAHIHKFGYVETLFNRRRRFPLQQVNGFFRGQAERRGKNMKIQSTSSDIVLGQLVELDEHIAEIGGRLCITVHDSIVATVKRKYAKQLPDFLNYYCVKRVEERYPWLPVSFACDIEAGPSYGETMSMEKYLAAEEAAQPTPEEAMYIELDDEALAELREDEEEAKAREDAERAEARKAQVG